jgi:Protein of unknown function (DUF1161)
MRRRAHARWLTLPALLLAGGAQGQTGACEQLTARLAARIESTGVRGYSLEVVPAAAPMPRDGKVIGTCEAGARKVVYRRWGGAAAASPAPAAPPPAALTAAPPAPPPEPPPVPEAAAPVVAAAAPVAPVIQPAPPASSAVESPASAAQPEPSASPGQAAASAAVPDAGGASSRIPGWLAEHGLWLAALLVLVAGGWIWRSRFSAYDEGGLPRGPRL